MLFTATPLCDVSAAIAHRNEYTTVVTSSVIRTIHDFNHPVRYDILVVIEPHLKKLKLLVIKVTFLHTEVAFFVIGLEVTRWLSLKGIAEKLI
jgi:hypothetical protein